MGPRSCEPRRVAQENGNQKDPGFGADSAQQVIAEVGAVLTNIPKDSPAYGEEFFGPVASIFRVKDQDEAIRIANDVRFGPGASAWTNNDKERERFINKLEAGMVFINKMVASDPRVLFGGVKQSGHGRELGAHGIREFVNAKMVWVA